MDFSYDFQGLIPNKYRVLPLKFEPVVSDVKYEDGGVDFNENSETARQEWEFVYDSLPPEIANEFDKFYKDNWHSRPFEFIDKEGKVHQDCFIVPGSYRANHDSHKSWKQNRSFRIVKYDFLVPTDFEDPTVPSIPIITNLKTSQFNASYTASADNIGVTGYKIKIVGGGETIVVDVGNTIIPLVTGLALKAQTLYSFSVAAYDAAGNLSDYSTATQATTPFNYSAISTNILFQYEAKEESGYVDDDVLTTVTDRVGNYDATDVVNVTWKASDAAINNQPYFRFSNGRFLDVDVPIKAEFTFLFIAKLNYLSFIRSGVFATSSGNIRMTTAGVVQTHFEGIWDSHQTDMENNYVVFEINFDGQGKYTTYVNKAFQEMVAREMGAGTLYHIFQNLAAGTYNAYKNCPLILGWDKSLGGTERDNVYAQIASDYGFTF